jgi:hypothetical protein
MLDWENRNCHESHTVAKALKLTEARFVDLGTFGVEGMVEPPLQFLNSGDTYGLTVLYWKGRFMAGNWGDIAERYLPGE